VDALRGGLAIAQLATTASRHLAAVA
jgi:hypothetical protein